MTKYGLLYGIILLTASALDLVLLVIVACLAIA